MRLKRWPGQLLRGVSKWSPGDLEGFILDSSQERSASSTAGKESALGEHLPRVGGPGAPLSPDLMKFQSRVSPLHHPQEVAKAAGSSRPPPPAGFKPKALGSLIACNHLV